MIKKWIVPIIGLLVGGTSGLAYQHYFGCTNGCPLQSSPYFMTAYGSLLGLFALQTIAEIATKLKNGRSKRTTQHDESSIPNPQ